MRLTMKARKTVTKAFATQYQRACKGDKGLLLNQFLESTGYNRHYAAWLLRHHGKRVALGPNVVMEGDVRVRLARSHPSVYDAEVLKALKKVWEMMDYLCGKRLAAALPKVVPHLASLGELRVKASVRKRLVAVSAATIDRLLKPERDKHTLKSRARTKPGTLLKHQVPIRTFSDWQEKQPGFFETDLVGHDGGCAEGDYCFTLCMTDVATGWTEVAAVRNKAQKWVFEALQALRGRLPFPVLGLDSDNGGEFINHHLVAYCKEQRITFTRSRPYRKNDTCYVEQKNWSIARRYAGYARYDTPEACALLNELYVAVRDYTNFFLPSMKLQEKVREGARVHKRHDKPKTPYERVLESPTVSPAVKKRLRCYYEGLNLAELWRRIRRVQGELGRVARRGGGGKP